MKNGTNVRPRPNWTELLESLQFHQITVYADERQQDIFVDLAEQDEENLRATLRYESALLDEVADFLYTDEARYAVLRLGSLLGTVESFDRVLFEQAQDQWAQARFQKEAYQVKHLPEVVRALETHGSMFHAELSEYLHINPPTLTEAMKKVLATGAVQASTVGKYKVYALTDSGLRYGREFRKKSRSGNPLDEALQTVREYAKNTNNAAELSAFWNKLHSMLDERPSVEVHPEDILHLSCYSPVDQSIMSENIAVQAIAITNKSSRDIWLSGVMKTSFPKKRTKALLSNYFSNTVSNP